MHGGVGVSISQCVSVCEYVCVWGAGLKRVYVCWSKCVSLCVWGRGVPVCTKVI